MRFLSVCSGIEAASVAWNPLGWKAVAFSEIEPFPCAVLAHHYPDVPNLSDMTKFKDWPDAAIDLLCGGTPCQSFSVAGLRKGLADPRGDLMLTFGAIAARYRPRWLVWENVPGVLSSNEGRDFGAFLGMLGQLGYGFAYRVLDAQYFGVAQRRRRVFVVGSLGDWRSAAAVLFERHSLQGHPAPSRETGQRAARPIAAGSDRGSGYRNDADTADDLIAGTLNANGKAAGSATQQDAEAGLLVAYTLSAARGSACANAADLETYVPVSMCLNAKGGFDVAHALTGDGFDGSVDSTGRGTPLVPIAFGWQNSAAQGASASASEHHSPTLDKSKTPAVALALRGRDGGATAELGDEVQNALRASGGGGDKAHIFAAMQVRRLTPRECERLQGFPDDYTLIPHGTNRAKDFREWVEYLRLRWTGLTDEEARRLAADGPRYKALGNSWAVPVVRWIGQRIEAVEAAHAMKEAA